MPEAKAPSRIPALLVSVGARVYALPVADVVETLRPLPTEPLAGMPPFVSGLSVIRGDATPVLDLQALLTERPNPGPGRWVLVRAGARHVALAVDTVQGLRELGPAMLQAMPPLLAEAQAERVQTVGRLDAQLLMVLDAARLMPEPTP